MNDENRGKACGVQVVSTTRSGMVGHMDSGSLEKAQFKTMISTKRNVIDYSSKWTNAIYFLVAICGSES